MKKSRLIFPLFLLALVNTGTVAATEFPSAKHTFAVDIVVEGLDHPWGMAFLPGGDLLITERSGKLRRVVDGKLLEQAVSGLPKIHAIDQGGLLGISLHPQFATNRLVYLSYTGGTYGDYGTEVVRGTLDGMALKDTKVIFRALPKQDGGYHFGSRLQFAVDGTLYITLGDRGNRPAQGRSQTAQQLGTHPGSLIRINDDGSVPTDNPYVNKAGARPEIYSYGHRNMQGIALHPQTQAIWTHEHGPQGGDEININRPGANYGWPVITYGVNYVIGTAIGEGTHLAGMEQPVYKWVPSIAPSGMLFYTGDHFPRWQGNLFVGSLKFGVLVRLELEGERVTSEERLLDFQYGRIRDVVQGPEGDIWLLTDDSDGKLLRVRPVN
jgi:glucose/arabinose dehydrogenase